LRGFPGFFFLLFVVGIGIRIVAAAVVRKVFMKGRFRLCEGFVKRIGEGVLLRIAVVGWGAVLVCSARPTGVARAG
jgi:hypothetical protein